MCSMARMVFPWAIRWGIRPLLGHGRAAWVALLLRHDTCMHLLQQEREALPTSVGDLYGEWR
jgi:hypothetical protein